jgi:hypothetical protein
MSDNWYEDEEGMKPKFQLCQLRYNWHVTEEEERESLGVTVGL